MLHFWVINSKWESSWPICWRRKDHKSKHQQKKIEIVDVHIQANCCHVHIQRKIFENQCWPPRKHDENLVFAQRKTSYYKSFSIYILFLVFEIIKQVIFATPSVKMWFKPRLKYIICNYGHNENGTDFIFALHIPHFGIARWARSLVLSSVPLSNNGDFDLVRFWCSLTLLSGIYKSNIFLLSSFSIRLA